MLTEAKEDEWDLFMQQMLGEAEGSPASHQPYLELYESLIRPRAQDTIVQVDKPILRTPRDLLRLVSTLKAHPHYTRNEFSNQICSLTQPNPPTDAEIENAIDVTVHLMFMVDCTIVDSHSVGYEISGYKPTKWRGHEQLSEFVSQAFPIDPASDRSRTRNAQRNCNMLKGWKLKKRAHVTFRPTDDLREHLLYDPQGDVVRLFRHTAYLKSHLRKLSTAQKPLDCDLEECLQIGTLPPRLLLETLHSLQYILFPSFDEKSFSLLDKLVHGSRCSLDPDSLVYDGLIWPDEELPPDFEYQYWGNRLATLHNLILNPKPQHRIGQWVQRHTSERNALYVALLGLFLAVLFGFLRVIIGIIQTWISYQAWKHPLP